MANFHSQNAAPDVVKVLAGNKCECTAAQRAVDKERGDKVSQKCNFQICSLDGITRK
jgi:hypothetical protein